MTTIEIKSLMQRLRDETQEHHRRAETKPLEQVFIGGRPSRREYAAFLEQRYLIHRVLEARVRRLTKIDPRVAEIVRETSFQTENLRRDLAEFGISADGPAESCREDGTADDGGVEDGTDGPRACPATLRLIAAIEDAATVSPISLLGIYYVFEGSKNGARFIAGRIGPLLGLALGGPGLLYLDPHGTEQRPLWQAFKQHMDAAVFTHAEIDAQVTAARWTFDLVAEIDDEIMMELEHHPIRPPTPRR